MSIRRLSANFKCYSEDICRDYGNNNFLYYRNRWNSHGNYLEQETKSSNNCYGYSAIRCLQDFENPDISIFHLLNIHQIHQSIVKSPSLHSSWINTVMYASLVPLGIKTYMILCTKRCLFDDNLEKFNASFPHVIIDRSPDKMSSKCTIVQNIWWLSLAELN